MSHYKLVAYVGRGKDDPVPLWSGDDGYQHFNSIFNSRPDWSQFAVLQRPDGKYLCVDMFGVSMNMETYDLIVPPTLEFDDLDAAIMAAQFKLM